MVVYVNKTGREHKTFGVDNTFVLPRLEISDRANALAGNAYIYFAQRFAQAVRDAGIDDHYRRAFLRKAQLNAHGGNQQYENAEEKTPSHVLSFHSFLECRRRIHPQQPTLYAARIFP